MGDRAPFVIQAEAVDRLHTDSGLSIQSFLASMVEPTRALARPPISGFHVGAVGLGPSGRVYRGVNLEFPGLPLHHAVHAEQFLVANAAQYGERSLKYLAVSAAPCGHCRQFLQELRGAADVEVLIVDSHAETQSLSQFLPHRFGPHDLLDEVFPLMLEPQENGLYFSSKHPVASLLPSSILTSQRFAYNIACINDNPIELRDLPKDSFSDYAQFCHGCVDANNIPDNELNLHAASQNGVTFRDEDSYLDLSEYNDAEDKIPQQNLDSLRNCALRAANSSYAPYSRCHSGLSMMTKKGETFSGSYLESAAYNPSLSPLQAAIVSFISHGGGQYEDIVHAVLVERDGALVQQAETVRLALDKISPRCSLHVYKADIIRHIS